MATAILTYIDHAPTLGIVCTICLDPVAQKAVQISCHKSLDCAECMAYWMESQVIYKNKATCPRCRKVAESSNLVAPDSSIEWKDVHDMECEESDAEVDDEEEYGGQNNSSWGNLDEDEDVGEKEIDNEDEASDLFGSVSIAEEDEHVNEDKVSELSEDLEGFGIADQKPIEHENVQKGGAGVSRKRNNSLEAVMNDEMYTNNENPAAAEFARGNRQRNVRHKTLFQHEIFELLSHHGNIPFNFTRFNTFFVPSINHKSSILLCGKHRVQGKQGTDDYFFWVHGNTTIGELVTWWIGVGINEFPMEGQTWVFDGNILRWSERVESSGMKMGSTFEILDDGGRRILAKSGYFGSGQDIPY